MGNKINIDCFVIDDVFDMMNTFVEKVKKKKKNKKKHHKDAGNDSSDEKMVINISV